MVGKEDPPKGHSNSPAEINHQLVIFYTNVVVTISKALAFPLSLYLDIKHFFWFIENSLVGRIETLSLKCLGNISYKECFKILIKNATQEK